jgi:hypothetical protein
VLVANGLARIEGLVIEYSGAIPSSFGMMKLFSWPARDSSRWRSLARRSAYQFARTENSALLIKPCGDKDPLAVVLSRTGNMDLKP